MKSLWRSLSLSLVLSLVLVLVLGLGLAACSPTQGTIGAVLAQRANGRLFVHDAPRGLAADKAGLEPGDEILLVDGVDVRRMDEKAIHAALSGDVGTKVKLTVVRGEEVLRLTIERTPARKYRPDEMPR